MSKEELERRVMNALADQSLHYHNLAKGMVNNRGKVPADKYKKYLECLAMRKAYSQAMNQVKVVFDNYCQDSGRLRYCDDNS